ncbi:MAG: oligosaccharide flippase family protein [Candidatus Sulfotelmatobacter sp.]
MGKGTLFGVFSNLTTVGTRLITVPIIIGHLGLGGYGIWSIIMTSAGYMRFGTAGLKSAFQKYVAEAMADGNFDRANKLLTTGSLAMLVFSFVGLIPVTLFAAPLARHAGVPLEFLDATAGAITLLAVIMVLSNFAAVFEAIVMGAQRVDITRKFAIVLSLLECGAIITCIRLGHGLLAMTAVMAASEVVFIVCCYAASRRLLPQLRIALRHWSNGVIGELIRFAGSYQLVNILEILYASILPFAILRLFGAQMSGLYAVSTRLVAAATTVQNASVLPLLSGGALVFASGASEQLKSLLKKAFKWTTVVTACPVAFVASLGSTFVLAWTGQNDPLFGPALCLLSVAAFFNAISMTGLIMYRATGAALLDNVRQVLRIVILVAVVFVGKTLGFFGLLSGLAIAEFLGALFMLYVLKKEIPVFSPSELIPDTLKILGTVCVALVIGRVAGGIPIPWLAAGRFEAFVRIGMAGTAFVAAFLPMALIARCLSAAERDAMLGVFLPGRRRALI